VLILPPAVRIYVAVEPVDMRKSFHGLAAAVRGQLQLDPSSGHLFVFRNRRGNLLKAIFWDRTGYALLAKRLSKGTFALPVDAPDGAVQVTLDAAQLGLMLEGLDLRGARQRVRYQPRTVELAV
jgi:transposase